MNIKNLFIKKYQKELIKILIEIMLKLNLNQKMMI